VRRGRAWRVGRAGDDTGSVLPLVIGVLVLVIALLTVVTDVSTLWLARRSLQATVDGAALAGAQAVDLGTVYAGGASGDLRLDPAAARAAVTSYARAVPSARQLDGFRVTSIAVAATTVTVTARAVVRPPFLAFVTGSGVTVVADATARNTVG
jgi:uncharacterized membrane protein